MAIALTKSTWFIVGWVAQILGILMNGIYLVISKIGIPNVGLAIILFTIINKTECYDAAGAAEDSEQV